MFFSSGVAGLTSFGDAIVYLAIMGVLRIAGIYEESTPASVFNITLMTAVTLPFMAWEMRNGPLRARLRDGLLLSLTGIGTVFVGFWLLHNVDTAVLGYFIGALFFLFSSIKLAFEIVWWKTSQVEKSDSGATSELLSGPSGKLGGSGTGETMSASMEASPDHSSNAVEEKETSGVVALTAPTTGAGPSVGAGADESDGGATAAQHPHASTAGPQAGTAPGPSDGADTAVAVAAAPALAASAEKPLPYHWSIGDSYVPPPWPECLPPFWRAPAVVLIAGLGAGVLGGMLGVHGPPIVVGFALLKLGKDETRATFVVYAILELLLRLGLFFGDGIDGSRWPVYVTVCAVSLSAFVLGTWLRQGLDGPTVMRCLLGIVLIGACLQLGVTEYAVSAAVVLPIVAVWAIALLYWVWRGHREGWWLCSAVCGIGPVLNDEAADDADDGDDAAGLPAVAEPGQIELGLMDGTGAGPAEVGDKRGREAHVDQQDLEAGR